MSASRPLDKKFDAEFEEMEDLMGKAAEGQPLADVAMTAASNTRSSCKRLASAFDEAEIDMNQGLRRIRQLVAATSMATSALFSGTGDRMDNEHEYFQKA